jgi:hypothetical protein
LVQYLRDKNVSRIAQQSTTKKKNAGVSLETKYQIFLVGFENQKRKHNNGPKENKEGTSLCSKGGTSIDELAFEVDTNRWHKGEVFRL